MKYLYHTVLERPQPQPTHCTGIVGVEEADLIINEEAEKATHYSEESTEWASRAWKRFWRRLFVIVIRGKSVIIIRNIHCVSSL